MAKEMVPNRRYTEEFKLEALRLAESMGINPAAKRLGMPRSSLGNWARLKRSGKLGEVPRALANTALDARVAAIHGQARQSHGRPRISSRS